VLSGSLSQVRLGKVRSGQVRPESEECQCIQKNKHYLCKQHFFKYQNSFLGPNKNRDCRD
jgi:hypothetical protein